MNMLEAAREDDEVIIELDACGDLFDPLASKMQVWVRRTVEVGPGGGWPVIEVRGRRADVRTYIELHWGEDAVLDLEEAGEL